MTDLVGDTRVILDLVDIKTHAQNKNIFIFQVLPLPLAVREDEIEYFKQSGFR